MPLTLLPDLAAQRMRQLEELRALFLRRVLLFGLTPLSTALLDNTQPAEAVSRSSALLFSFGFSLGSLLGSETDTGTERQILQLLLETAFVADTENQEDPKKGKASLQEYLEAHGFVDVSSSLLRPHLPCRLNRCQMIAAVCQLLLTVYVKLAAGANAFSTVGDDLFAIDLLIQRLFLAPWTEIMLHCIGKVVEVDLSSVDALIKANS